MKAEVPLLPVHRLETPLRPRPRGKFHLFLRKDLVKRRVFSQTWSVRAAQSAQHHVQENQTSHTEGHATASSIQEATR